MEAFELIGLLRFTLQTASRLGEILERLQNGTQPTTEEIEFIRQVRKTATDDLVKLIDSKLRQ